MIIHTILIKYLVLVCLSLPHKNIVVLLCSLGADIQNVIEDRPPEITSRIGSHPWKAALYTCFRVDLKKLPAG